MRHVITIVLSLILALNTSAQENSKDVTITASGSGINMEEAHQSALRSATEQAFGAFISSKTEIFNDQIVADQMSSVSSGNIKSYEILNQDQLPDGRWGCTIKALVSVDKLTSFVQSKGIEIEIKGGLFALNIKQQMLNEEGEIQAVYAMVGLLHEPMQTAFDYSIKSSDPKSIDPENKNWEINLEVTATCNKNMDFCANYFNKTLAALSLSTSELESYKSLNKLTFPIIVNYQSQTRTYYLRKQSSIDIIKSLTKNWNFYTSLFSVKAGLNDFFGNDIKKTRFSFASEKNINFLTSGDIAGTFSWNDKRTLNQLEQMTGYSVTPKGIISYFKHGGFVVDESNGHGFVMSLFSIGGFNWSDANKNCDSLILNGYSDWRLPTKEEFRKIYVRLYQSEISNISNSDHFWTSTEEDNKYAWCFSIRSEAASRSEKEMIYKALPIRAF
jgi:hypothetical protein